MISNQRCNICDDEGYDQIFISSARISIWKASLVLDVGHQKVERVVLRVWPLDGSGVGAECR